MEKYFVFKVLVIIALITSSTMAIYGTLLTSKQQQGVIVLRLAENLAETNPVTVAMHKFSELVAILYRDGGVDVSYLHTEYHADAT